MKKAMLSAGIVAAVCSVMAYNGHTQHNHAQQSTRENASKLDSLQKADSLFAVNHASQKQELEIKRQKAEAELDKFNASVKKATNDREQAEIDIQRGELEMKRAEVDIELAEIEIQHNEITMAIAEIHIAQADMEITQFESLLGELEKITGEEITSFELNSTSLTVNGKKQSDELHREMRKKHLKPKTSMLYIDKNGQRTISVSDEK